MRLTCGLDLGQSQDHSALAGVEQVALPAPIHRRRFRYVVRLLDEYELGASYPDQVQRVARTLSHPVLSGSRCAVDYTGVGRPVYDLLRDANPPVLLYPVLTTSGSAATFDRRTRECHVPKSEQVALLQVLLQCELLNWHEKLSTARRLEQQLSKYRVRITRAKNETYGAESGTNDDLVSAVMLAIWLAEHVGSADPGGISVGDSAFDASGRPLRVDPRDRPRDEDDGILGGLPQGVFG